MFTNLSVVAIADCNVISCFKCIIYSSLLQLLFIGAFLIQGPPYLLV